MFDKTLQHKKGLKLSKKRIQSAVDKKVVGTLLN